MLIFIKSRNFLFEIRIHYNQFGEFMIPVMKIFYILGRINRFGFTTEYKFGYGCTRSVNNNIDPEITDIFIDYEVYYNPVCFFDI